MKEKVKFNDLSNNIQLLLVLGGALLVFCLVYIAVEDNNIKGIPNLPHKYCHNESINVTEPIWKEIECPCYKEEGCFMWCGESIGMKNVTIEKEVCEIR